MAGRPPDPHGLKVLKGRRPGKDSGGRSIPPPPPFRRMAPQKPANLSVLAAEHWDAIVPEMARLELLTPTHVGGLVMLCELWAAWAGEGLSHHSVEVAREYRLLATQFGLTPSAEGKLKPREVDDAKGDNPFAPRQADLAGG